MGWERFAKTTVRSWLDEIVLSQKGEQQGNDRGNENKQNGITHETVLLD